MLTATHISLVFLGILIVMVLLEVRKLSRRPEPGRRLEEQVEHLSQQIERIGPNEMVLPGGARLVAAERRFETLSEQLERLGESTEELYGTLLTEEGVRRLVTGLEQLQAELSMARSLFEETAHELGQASDSLASAGAALRRIETQLEDVLVLAPATAEGDDA